MSVHISFSKKDLIKIIEENNLNINTKLNRHLLSKTLIENLDSNKKYSITDLLKIMPEECGREFVRRGNETFGPGRDLPDYDQIMKRKLN